MELKLNKEEICCSEVILSLRQEQAVELDYVLPDYYPEIFKIIKCRAVPRIVNYSVNGDKLSYEMSVSVTVLYCAENSGKIHSVEQKLMYSKTADMGRDAVSPEICIRPKMDYVNCRAVNQRRIDVRGAVSADIRVTDTVKNELVCDAFGMGMQLHKIPLTYPASQLHSSAQVSVYELFDLGMSKPAVDSIIWLDAVITSTDKKIIANKLIAKGEMLISILYTTTESEAVEAMDFALQFSKIIDMEGIDERYECIVEADVASLEIVPKADGDGNAKTLDCSVTLNLNCSAVHSETVEIADDGYSTDYVSENTPCEIKADLPPKVVCTTETVKTSVAENFSHVYSSKSRVKDYNLTPDSEANSMNVNGTIVFEIIGCNAEGMPITAEKEEAFTASVPSEDLRESSYVDVKLIPLSCSYNMNSENGVDLKSELKICIKICGSTILSGISDIAVDESSPAVRDGDYAVKLYFAESDELLWNIAKRFRTSVDAILDENNLEGEYAGNSGMIIIPIV